MRRTLSAAKRAHRLAARLEMVSRFRIISTWWMILRVRVPYRQAGRMRRELDRRTRDAMSRSSHATLDAIEQRLRARIK